MADDTYSRGYRNDPYDRGGTGGSGSAPDPLTELARLIGQSDPFATDRNRQPDPRQAEAHPQSGDWRADPAQHAQHYDHGAQDERYADTGEPQHDTGQDYGSEGHASYPNGYAYPQAAQHDARYGDAAGHGEQPYHDEPQAYHPDQHPYHQDQAAYPPSGQPQYAAGQGEQAEYDDAAQADPHGGYPAPSFFGDPNSRPDDYYEDEPTPRRGWLVTAAALIGLAVVGTAGALAYRAVFTGGETRIITRDVGPSKITPQASQDSANKANERLAAAGGQNERLGPPPEQPITIPEPPRTVPPAIAPSQSVPAAPALPAAPSAAAPATAPADNGARKVRTEKIKPEQLDAAATRPVGPPRVNGPSPVQPAQPRVVGPGPAAPAPNAPLSLAPQGIANPPAPAPAPPMHTTAIAPPAAPAAPAVERNSGGGSGYFVQLSAQKSEDEAKSSFRGIQARHASLLGGQQPVIRRKDLGSKGVFYGAQVGPLSREEAAKLCEGLKAAGQSCMIQRN